MSILQPGAMLLTDEEMHRIHDAALHVLQHSGLRVENEEILSLLQELGCAVDRSELRARFPARVVEESLAHLRRYAADPGGFPPTHQPFSAPDFGVRTGGFTTTVRGLDDQRRSADRETARQAIHLADALPHISHVGIPISAQEIDPAIRTVEMAADLIKITAKPGMVEAWTSQTVEWLWEMAVVARGSREAAQQHPVMVGYVGLRSPLCLDAAMAEVLIEYSRRGIPYLLYTMPCWASTAPATSAGVLVLGVAEVLGGLVIGQAIHKGARPLIYIAPGALDMQSMLMDVASPMRLNLSVAATQMIGQFYGLPCGANCGKTAANVTDVQAGYEKAASILYPVLAGASSVGPIGQVENGFVFSFRQLVIDHEIVTFVKHLLQGIEVTTETLAIEAIESCGPGGNFLSSPHTRAHFRRELWVPDVSERLGYDAWLAQPGRGAEDRALERARAILAQPCPRPLSVEQEVEIDRIVQSARRELAVGSAFPVA